MSEKSYGIYKIEKLYYGRMSSSGMLRRVAFVSTDVSEEYVAFIIRVIRISELGITLAVTINRNTLRSNTIQRR
jgi:hypothetical protein